MKAIQFLKRKNSASNLHINAGIPVHKLPMFTFNILTTPNLQFVFYVRQFSQVSFELHT
jgi:hypothetical protein